MITKKQRQAIFDVLKKDLVFSLRDGQATKRAIEVFKANGGSVPGHLSKSEMRVLRDGLVDVIEQVIKGIEGAQLK